MALRRLSNLSILKAIDRAYRVSQERKYDRIYWSLDLHGTVLHGNYLANTYEWISPEIPGLLRKLSEFDETHFILWSSLHPEEIPNVLRFFHDAGIHVFAVNGNPLEGNTQTGNFDAKFYTSIIVDDKAGFDPADWDQVYRATIHYRERYGFTGGNYYPHRSDIEKWPLGWQYV